MGLLDWIEGRTARFCVGCGWFSYTSQDHDCDERYGSREIENVTPANLKRWIDEAGQEGGFL